MASIRQSKAGSEAGFTLTELLVVLGIVGLLVAAIPVLLRSAIPGTQALAAARLLAQELRIARGAAISAGGTTTVRFDAAKQTYVVEPGDQSHRLPNGVHFALPPRGADTIGFYADGSSSGGVVLVGDGGTRHRVAADWLTGRITVDE